MPETSPRTLAPPHAPAEALPLCLARIRRVHRQFGDRFPKTGTGLRYRLTENDNWFTGFWPGVLWLAYTATTDESLRTQAMALLPSFADRLAQDRRLDHDLGFLYTLSARAQWQITGEETARALGLDAAEALARRFRPQGRYIQAWGPVGHPAEGGRMIVDALMNLPLLWWAAEQTGETRYGQIAAAHAETSLRYLLRPDGSTYHTYVFDQASGEPLGPRTKQGYTDDSLWARGQAWAIYGFTLAFEWTGAAQFLQAARQAAARFMAELPDEGVPLWDLRLAEDAPPYLDSSAGAIAAGGLLRLARWHTGPEQAHYQAGAVRLLQALLGCCFETDPEGQGLLRHGNYDTPDGDGLDGYLIFGDYFFLEALLGLAGQAPDFWGPTTKSA